MNFWHAEGVLLSKLYNGPIKTWAHSYSGKARKNMFFASRRPAHNTQVSQERFWSKNEKSIFDDVILDDDTILDDDVVYIGQTTRDLIKI